ncbi:MAG TPA: hypothetical protein VMW56_12495 [Candidatus Margulisiibacteriota bacterium]|nr:hypothetical protein [Candidatus Margulisiibacteriota bacterium]
MRNPTIAIVLAVVACATVGCGSNEINIAAAPTATPTATATPSPIPTLGLGANIGFMGVLRADDSLLDPSGVDAAGRLVYVRTNPSGFILVIDAKPGTNGAPVGTNAFSADSTKRPDLQIEVSRSIGNGSDAVCDNTTGNFGGVPGIDPPSYAGTQTITNALNDLACRFNDGSGVRKPGGRTPDAACPIFGDGESRFVDPTATIEFCGFIDVPLAFPDGDTIVTARVLDTSGIPGPQRQIVIRINRR